MIIKCVYDPGHLGREVCLYIFSVNTLVGIQEIVVTFLQNFTDIVSYFSISVKFCQNVAKSL